MKRNKKAKFEVKGPEGIENGLMGMGRAIEAGGPWTHPEMDRIPEWRRRVANESFAYGAPGLGHSGFVCV